MDAQEFYVRIGHLVAEIPNLENDNRETMLWLQRAVVLVEQSGSISDTVKFTQMIENHPNSPQYWAQKIIALLHKILFRAELNAPADSSGSFIPAGNELDAMTAVGKVLKTAKSDVLIVDPYMDEVVLNDFAVMIPDGINLRLLADPFSQKPTLKPAVTRWIAQYAATRPLEARYTSPRALHDRLIEVDNTKVWTLSQSFAHLVKRSPAMIMIVAPDIAELKIPAYEAIWASSTPI